MRPLLRSSVGRTQDRSEQRRRVLLPPPPAGALDALVQGYQSEHLHRPPALDWGKDSNSASPWLSIRAQYTPAGPVGVTRHGGGSDFQTASFFRMAPRTWQNTAPNALESISDGAQVLGSVDSAAESGVPWGQFAGCLFSRGRFHRSDKPSGAADPSGLGCWVARQVTFGQPKAACSAWPRAAARGGARACMPRCVRIFSTTGASKIAA